MTSLVSSLLSYVLLYRYATLAVVAYVSAFGVPLPSNTLILAVGAFASQGIFSFWLALAVAVIANVLGDCTGYAVTRIWGTKIVTKTGLKRFKVVDRLDRFLRKNAAWTVMLSRFNGLPSVLVNFLAGFAEVPFATFLLFDIIGNTIDSGLFLGAGYLLGVLWQKYTYITTIVSVAGFVLLAIYSVYKLMRPGKDNEDTGLLDAVIK